MPPLGDSIPIDTVPLAIDGSIPLIDVNEWEVYRLWRHRLGIGVRHSTRTLAILAGSSNTRGMARHGQLGLGGRNSLDGIQGRQATDGVYVEGGVPHP